MRDVALAVAHVNVEDNMDSVQAELALLLKINARQCRPRTSID